MGQEKVYMGQESLLGWDKRRRFDGTEKVDVHPNKTTFLATNVPFLLV